MQKREIAQGILFPNGMPGQKQASVQAGPAIPPELVSKYEAIIKSEPGGYPATPANIKALYDKNHQQGGLNERLRFFPSARSAKTV